MAYWMVACSVYLHIAIFGVNIHICRISRVWVGQPGWRPVMVASTCVKAASAASTAAAPGAAGAQVVHVHRCAHAELRAPAAFHVLRMPDCVAAKGR
jgi:hypothetical protein